MRFKVLLETPGDVEEFVNIASAFEYDIDLKSGVVYIDAKSLLGVMTYGMKRELEVYCQNDCPDKFVNRIRKFAAC